MQECAQNVLGKRSVGTTNYLPKINKSQRLLLASRILYHLLCLKALLVWIHFSLFVTTMYDHIFFSLHDNAGNTFLGCNEGAARADSRIIPSHCPSPFLSPVPPMLTQCLGKHPNNKFGHFLTKRERENTQYVWSIFPPDWTNRNVLTNILYRPENKPFLCSFWIQGVNYTITNM